MQMLVTADELEHLDPNEAPHDFLIVLSVIQSMEALTPHDAKFGNEPRVKEVRTSLKLLRERAMFLQNVYTCVLAKETFVNPEKFKNMQKEASDLKKGAIQALQAALTVCNPDLDFAWGILWEGSVKVAIS